MSKHTPRYPPVTCITPSMYAHNSTSCTGLLSTVQDSTVQYSTVQYSTIQNRTVQNNTVRYGTVRYGTVRYGTVWYGTVRYTHDPRGSRTTNEKRYPAENEQHIITLCICSAGLEYQIWTMCLTAWHACVPELYTDCLFWMCCSVLRLLDRRPACQQSFSVNMKCSLKAFSKHHNAYRPTMF